MDLRYEEMLAVGMGERADFRGWKRHAGPVMLCDNPEAPYEQRVYRQKHGRQLGQQYISRDPKYLAELEMGRRESKAVRVQRQPARPPTVKEYA
jgi:hypothetical protein